MHDIWYNYGFDEAAGKFQELADKMTTPEEKARAYHNMGNSELMNQKIDESIETYKKALRQNPTDLDTKYNLAYAQLLKKKKQEQQQKQVNVHPERLFKDCFKRPIADQCTIFFFIRFHVYWLPSLMMSYLNTSNPIGL